MNATSPSFTHLSRYRSRPVERSKDLEPSQADPAPQDRPIFISVIDPRSLDRECFVRCISMGYSGLAIEGFDGIEGWRIRRREAETQVVVYNIGAAQVDTPAVAAALRQLVAEAAPAPVIVLGDSENFQQTIGVFDCGAHGYMPSSVGLDAIVRATELSSAGGVYLPMVSIAALRNAFVGLPKAPPPVIDGFTDREVAVSNALRRGKSNKIIAYELNLCESTVKVHIRNIMKKLRASNRTEAAFKLNVVCFEGSPA